MKATLLIAAIAFAGLSSTAFANDAYPNGPKDIPGSSTAATPSSVKSSPGTVGAMKDSDDGSFTASKASQAQEHLGGGSTSK